MRIMNPALKARFAQEVTHWCWVFLIQLKSGEQYKYTDASDSIVVEGVVYRADPGISVSAIRDTDTSFNQTATIEIGYDESMITEEIARKGGLDGATFALGCADYTDRSIPFVEVFSGYVDRLTASNKYSCSVDLTGWQTKSVQFPGVYSLKCRNVFCDRGCGLNLANYSYPFTVTGEDEGAVSGDGTTIGSDAPAADHIGAYGSVLWTHGRNTGEVTAIADNVAGQIRLTAPPPYLPRVGDKGILRAGCDFYGDTCKNTYNNLNNFEGEPAVPVGTELSGGKFTENTTVDENKPEPRAEPVYTSSAGNPDFAPYG